MSSCRATNAKDALLATIRAALAARDERIAALEAGLREAVYVIGRLTDPDDRVGAIKVFREDLPGLDYGGDEYSALYLPDAAEQMVERLRAIADAGKADATIPSDLRALLVEHAYAWAHARKGDAESLTNLNIANVGVASWTRAHFKVNE